MTQTPQKLPPSDLTEREERALQNTLKANEPMLSPTLSNQLFELYLHNPSCEALAKTNPGLRLGTIVRACVDGDWPTRRREHQASLMTSIQDRVKQVQLEGIEFSALYMAVHHKLWAPKLMKYLQTGDEKDLDGLDVGGMKQYKEVAAILLTLTGQDKKEPGKGTTNVFVNAGGAAPGAPKEVEGQVVEGTGTSRSRTPEEAAKMLLKLAEMDGE